MGFRMVLPFLIQLAKLWSLFFTQGTWDSLIGILTKKPLTLKWGVPRNLNHEQKGLKEKFWSGFVLTTGLAKLSLNSYSPDHWRSSGPSPF